MEYKTISQLQSEKQQFEKDFKEFILLNKNNILYRIVKNGVKIEQIILYNIYEKSDVFYDEYCINLFQHTVVCHRRLKMNELKQIYKNNNLYLWNSCKSILTEILFQSCSKVKHFLYNKINDGTTKRINENFFSQYPKLLKYDEEKLIINDETKDLTLEEYKNWIEEKNSNTIKDWENSQLRKMEMVGKYIILGAANPWEKKLSPCRIGKTTLLPKKRQLFIEDSLYVLLSSHLDDIKIDNRPYVIGGDYGCDRITILSDKDISELQTIWFDFIRQITKFF